MDLQSSIDLLRQRVTWPEMRSILKSNQLPTALGWDKTSEKIKEHLTSDSDKNLAANVLFQAYKETLLYGTKVVWLFSLDKDLMAQLFDKLKQISVAANPYLTKYPEPLPLLALQQQSVHPMLVDSQAYSKRHDLVFCSKRHYSVREEIDVAKLGSAQQTAFGGFESLIGLRNELRQGFDVLSLHRDSGLIELRVDLILGVTWEDNLMFLEQLRAELFKVARTLLHPLPFEPEKANFFPLLQKLYDDTDGRVVEIGHDTGGTGGIIREKMRRRSLDVRDEDFHKAGSLATNIELFEIAKVWSLATREGEFEVHVPGSVRLLSELAPNISEVIVKGCISKEHYKEAFSKFTSHV